MAKKVANKNNHTKLKLDFNLLQSGTWVLEKKGNQRIHYFEKEIGDGRIVIYNALDVPSPFDSKVLDYLMLKSQENDWSQEIVIPTISTIIKELGLRKEKRVAERIKRSLKILKNTHIEFHNCFIDNGVLEHFEEGTWELVSIGIIEEYGFKKTKGRGNPLRVRVKFTNSFISLCKYSLGYKLIPYAPIQGLRDTAYALYKWAWRWYNTEKGYGERWIGDGKKLVEWYRNELNSTANYKYPSKVLERVNSAIKQLNENKEVPFYLQLKQEDGNYKIEIYRKEQCTIKKEIPYDKLPAVLRKAVISLIRRKKHIKEPYALVRSMSWKEIETTLKNVAVLQVSNDAWEIFEMVFQANKKEKEEFDRTVLTVFKDDDKVQIAAAKSKFRSKNILTKLLEAIFPSWKEHLHDAVKLMEGEKVLSKA